WAGAVAGRPNNDCYHLKLRGTSPTPMIVHVRLMRTLQRDVQGASLPERNKRGHAPTVGFVLLPKALRHPTLFQSKLAPQRPPSDKYGEYTAPFPASHGRTDEGNQ